MRARIFVSTAVAAAAVLLALAAPQALAITASATTTTLTITGGDEANAVVINGGGNDTYYITDSAGVAVGPAGGCSVDPSNPNGLICGAATTTIINVALGGGNDSFADDGYFLWHHATSTFTVDGGPGDDNISLLISDGTFDSPSTGHVVTGGDGNDIIKVGATATGGHNEIDGGAGDDNITAFGTNTIHGGDGNDTVQGGSGNDTIYGEAGDDHLSGGAGDDTIDGGPGHDTLVGDSSDLADVGNDTINAVDGEADTVSCGLGADVVNADVIDTVDSVNCETVNRTGSGPSLCPPGETGTPPNCTAPSGPGATQLTLSLPPHQTPVKSKQLRVTVGCSATCYTGAFAEVKIGSAKPFEVDSNVTQLAAAGSETISLKFSHKQLQKLKSALAAHKKIVAKITAVLTNKTGSSNFAVSGQKTLRIRS